MSDSPGCKSITRPSKCFIRCVTTGRFLISRCAACASERTTGRFLHARVHGLAERAGYASPFFAGRSTAWRASAGVPAAPGRGQCAAVEPDGIGLADERGVSAIGLPTQYQPGSGKGGEIRRENLNCERGSHNNVHFNALSDISGFLERRKRLRAN